MENTVINADAIITQDLLFNIIKSLHNEAEDKTIKLFIKHNIEQFNHLFINELIKLYTLIEMEFNVKTINKSSIDDNDTKARNENLSPDLNSMNNGEVKPLMKKRMLNIDETHFHFDEFIAECYQSIVNVTGPDLYQLYCNYVDTHVDLFKDFTLMPSSKVFILSFRKFTGNSKQKWLNNSKKFVYSLKPNVYIMYSHHH